mmetsp:Transcript_85743/g.205511  ORF Transcript_85743/g.205511 Transcript_85743/m.205511 type:complete len:238 (+) Transcript_85743:198-911(+)
MTSISAPSAHSPWFVCPSSLCRMWGSCSGCCSTWAPRSSWRSTTRCSTTEASWAWPWTSPRPHTCQEAAWAWRSSRCPGRRIWCGWCCAGSACCASSTAWRCLGPTAWRCPSCRRCWRSRTWSGRRAKPSWRRRPSGSRSFSGTVVSFRRRPASSTRATSPRLPWRSSPRPRARTWRRSACPGWTLRRRGGRCWRATRPWQPSAPRSGRTSCATPSVPCAGSGLCGNSLSSWTASSP